MDKISPIKDKILQFIDNQKITKEEFYEKTGISPSNFKGRGLASEVGGEKLVKILSVYSNLNADWLLKNEGEMLQTKYKETLTELNSKEKGKEIRKKRNIQKTLPSRLHVVSETAESYNETSRKIPFYDCVTINGVGSVADLSPITTASDYIDPGDLFRDADAGMRTYEDSMIEYPSGCAIFLKEVRNKELVVFGNDYVIETTEYRVTKRLQRSLKEGYWTLASTNMEVWHSGPLEGRLIHEPFDVNIDYVLRIFKVLGVTTRTGSSKILMNTVLRKD